MAILHVIFTEELESNISKDFFSLLYVFKAQSFFSGVHYAFKLYDNFSNFFIISPSKVKQDIDKSICDA